jgi:molecular chaperone DnaK
MEVGEFARRQWGNALGTAAARFKRDMGTSTKHYIGDTAFTPTQLSALVLRKLVADATSQIGRIDEAVVTIPANFAHEAREATLSAAKAAGLNIRFIINEPTAAALYYAFKNSQALNGHYAVYDLGGGTFDISIIKVVGQNIDVIASNGIAKLGGDDFDAALQKIVQKKYAEQTGKSLSAQDFTKNEAETEKKSLSVRRRVTVRVARELVDVTQEEFEEAISSLVTQAEMLCEATVEEAKIDLSDIEGIFLVGGSTRVPLVQESVRRVFAQEPVNSENVDEVVALGAALYSAYKSDGRVLSAVQKSVISRIKVAETASKCFGTISLGANGPRGQQALVNNVLIPKGHKIPCSVTRPFYTVHADQRAVNCQVTESVALETDPRFVKVIWKGELPLPPGRPAEQEIKVTFAYDDNQVMRCSFLDVSTGTVEKIDLSMGSTKSREAAEIDKFLVE